MDKKTFMRLWAIPLDIEKRARRIAQLEQLQADGPQTVSDVVKSSSGEGNATIICNATIRGADSDYIARERLISEMKAAQVSSRKAYAEGVRLIEGCDNPAVRTTLQVVCLEGGSYKDAAAECHLKGIPAGPDALRKQVKRWLESQNLV